MNVVITMAGEGSRFQKVGIKIPKFCIQVRGRSLFEWSLESLRNFFTNNTFIFVAQRKHAAKNFIAEHARALGISSFEIMEIDGLTGGQADTVLEARPLLKDLKDGLLIYNIDTYVEPQILLPRQIRGDGWIPVFEAEGEQWSFVRADENGRALEVAEKRRISSLATIGLYYFRSFALFEQGLSSSSFAGYKERFVAPIYQELLKDSARSIYIEQLPAAAVHVLGTPEDIQQFAPEFRA